MPATRPSPRFILIVVASLIAAIYFLSSISSHALPTSQHITTPAKAKDTELTLDPSILTGHAIAPKLGNETIKAELGRASWKLFHTMMARFPDEPTMDERTALKNYVHLFQRLYPCGECAEHFGELLKKFPPQTSSRSAAAAWACHVHNQVNISLKKETFDCANIGDFYDCGCAEDEADGKGKKDSGKETRASEESDILEG